MTDRSLIKAELQNLQKILEAKADMCIGAGKIKMLSFANACSGALVLLKEQEPTEYIYNEYAEPTCKNCGFRPFAGYIPTLLWMKERRYNYCPHCGKAVKWE